MRRLAKAGFKGDFVKKALLPDWWDVTCEKDPTLLPDLEIRVARFFHLPIQTIKDPNAPLALQPIAGVQLRRILDLDQDRLTPAIHAALQVASATIRSLKGLGRPPDPPPASGLSWRRALSPDGASLTLNRILADVWARGIPVVPVDHLPVPNFQGMACIIGNRPVIILGQKFDEPGRVAFLISHEIGHITNGDCSAGGIIVDAEDEAQDDAEIERRADQFGLEVVGGCCPLPALQSTDFRSLASEASRLERDRGIDAGVLISSWARNSRDYRTATMAIKALYRSSGARFLLRKHFDENVDVDGASESDRALLSCVYKDQESDEAAY